MKFKIVGDRQVAGKNPGDIVSEDELSGANIDALIEGGHLAPMSTKADKAATDQE